MAININGMTRYGIVLNDDSGNFVGVIPIYSNNSTNVAKIAEIFSVADPRLKVMENKELTASVDTIIYR